MNPAQPPVSLLSTPVPWDAVSSGYARTVKHDLAQYSEEAIPLARLTPSSRILDVACGPGTLSLLAANHVAHVTALDFSAEMLACFRDVIQKEKISNIDVYQGDGQNLPFADESFEECFSMFGLMFFPDRKKGFAELYRTLKPGGRAVVSSWAPIEKSPFMKTIFGAIRIMAAEAPAAAITMPSPLEDPAIFRQEMETTGFKNVEIKAVTKHFRISSLESFWKDTTEGNARLLMTKKGMDAATWREKEKKALDYLGQALPTLPTTLSSDAWLGVGIK